MRLACVGDSEKSGRELAGARSLALCETFLHSHVSAWLHGEVPQLCRHGLLVCYAGAGTVPKIAFEGIFVTPPLVWVALSKAAPGSRQGANCKRQP